jgi:predicted metalloendopeptidase
MILDIFNDFSSFAPLLKDKLLWDFLIASQQSFPPAVNKLKSKFYQDTRQIAPNNDISANCYEFLTGAFGDATGRIFVQSTLQENDKALVTKMVSDIGNSVKELLLQNSIMDDQTKKAAVKKYENIKMENIAFNNVSNDPTRILEYIKSFGNISALEFSDISMIINTQKPDLVKKKLNGYVEPNLRKGRIDDVDAYYSDSSNEMLIPSGILQPPFYSHDYLLALNLGALGTIIGHEFFHAFDNQGRLRDENGNLKDWWSETSAQNYNNASQCFINQYSNFTIEISDHQELNVNGSLTLTENIPDNMGLKAAYLSLKHLLGDQINQKSNYIGLENFTHEQLFYLSFANHKCKDYTPKKLEYSLQTDRHAPSKIRTNISLRNDPNFYQAFNCPKPSANQVCTMF